jgi:hypothetical protein
LNGIFVSRIRRCPLGKFESFVDFDGSDSAAAVAKFNRTLFSDLPASQPRSKQLLDDPRDLPLLPDSGDLRVLDHLLVDDDKQRLLAGRRPGVAASGHTIDPGQLSNWLSDIDVVNKSDELKALKELRHKGIAHTETPNLPPQRAVRVAVYGDEMIIIEKTISLAEQAGGFIGYSYMSSYADQRRLNKENAVKFWERVSTTTT